MCKSIGSLGNAYSPHLSVVLFRLWTLEEVKHICINSRKWYYMQFDCWIGSKSSNKYQMFKLSLSNLRTNQIACNIMCTLVSKRWIVQGSRLIIKWNSGRYPYLDWCSSLFNHHIKTTKKSPSFPHLGSARLFLWELRIIRVLAKLND